MVCPIIEESDKLEVASAEETYERLSTGELSGLRLALLHGRLSSAEKEAVMARFRVGQALTYWWPRRSSRSAWTFRTQPPW